MKKLLIIAAILFFASTAFAATATWQHDGLNTDGYTLYFYKSATPTDINTITVYGSTVRSIPLNNGWFAPGVEWTFEVDAFNAYDKSGKSVPVKWAAPGTPYTPPADKTPSVIYMKPSGVDQLIIQLTP